MGKKLPDTPLVKNGLVRLKIIAESIRHERVTKQPMINAVSWK